MAAPATASFPVVFFDGAREIDVGPVAVHPSLDFPNFRSIVSQKIGVPPHQISTSLIRRKRARPSPELRRRVPIDGSSDFAAISRERDCFVLAALRRPRRDRRGGRARWSDSGEFDGPPPPARRILKREAWMDLELAGGWRREAAPACGECVAAAARGAAPPFHWCVCDAVTEGFRSSVGPVQRPGRKLEEGSDRMGDWFSLFGY